MGSLSARLLLLGSPQGSCEERACGHCQAGSTQPQREPYSQTRANEVPSPGTCPRRTLPQKSHQHLSEEPSCEMHMAGRASCQAPRPACPGGGGWEEKRIPKNCVASLFGVITHLRLLKRQCALEPSGNGSVSESREHSPDCQQRRMWRARAAGYGKRPKPELHPAIRPWLHFRMFCRSSGPAPGSLAGHTG